MSELLNHLCCLGETTFVLRQQGLSLAKTTAFGLCVATRDGGWQVLSDHMSGLETDTGRNHCLYLLADGHDRRPVIGMAESGRAMHLTIRLDGHAWESPVTRNLVDHFGGVSLDCVESRRLGAGAWLDEWERPVPSTCEAARVREVCGRLQGCDDLEVQVSSHGHHGIARFRPSFMDVAGTVVRIADSPRRHVVHADVSDPGFMLAPGRGAIRLSVAGA